jgi:hypothetical protein
MRPHKTLEGPAAIHKPAAAGTNTATLRMLKGLDFTTSGNNGERQAACPGTHMKNPLSPYSGSNSDE